MVKDELGTSSLCYFYTFTNNKEKMYESVGNSIIVRLFNYSPNPDFWENIEIFMNKKLPSLVIQKHQGNIIFIFIYSKVMWCGGDSVVYAPYV